MITSLSDHVQGASHTYLVSLEMLSGKIHDRKSDMTNILISQRSKSWDVTEVSQRNLSVSDYHKDRGGRVCSGSPQNPGHAIG